MMRKPDPEAAVHRDIVTGRTIEIISAAVFVGCWIAALIMLATPMR